MPSTTGMKPGGFYDQNSTGQRSSIDLLLPWLEEAAGAIPLPDPSSPITIVDYGCSEGRNALAVLSSASSALRARGAANPIAAVFSDLATNNFNQVFRNLAEAGRLAADGQAWYPLAAGGSFYGPLLPPASVHLATTFNAVCWLDRTPAPLDDFVVCPPPWQHRPDVRVAPETRAAFVAQARDDMARFLQCRAAEMRPQARLLVAMPGRAEDSWTGGGLYDLLYDACVDLVQANRIQQSALRQLVMPVYFRSQEELLEPVRGSDHSLRDMLAIEKSEVQRVPTPFMVEYQQTGDLDRYVTAFVGFMQAFSEPIVRGALEANGSGDAVAEVYARARERLRAEPQKYAFDYIQVAAQFVRL